MIPPLVSLFWGGGGGRCSGVHTQSQYFRVMVLAELNSRISDQKAEGGGTRVEETLAHPAQVVR